LEGNLAKRFNQAFEQVYHSLYLLNEDLMQERNELNLKSIRENMK